jgi:hypothetical protein
MLRVNRQCLMETGSKISHIVCILARCRVRVPSDGSQADKPFYPRYIITLERSSLRLLFIEIPAFLSGCCVVQATNHSL